jgi:1,4-dihydroxy-2-naphthoate octaprenyltransferase
MTYTASVVPVLIGTAIAGYDGRFNLLLFLLTLIGGVAIQVGTNLVNDYFDYVKGSDEHRPTGTVGIGGAIQRGELTPRQVLIAGMSAFLFAALIGIYLTVVAGPLLLPIGIFGLLTGFFYTASPFALAYLGLGEIAVFIAMGPCMVLGAYYVQTSTITWTAAIASIPVGFLVAAILHANNLRDLDSDRVAGKRTMATRLGQAGAKTELRVLIAGGYVTQLIAVLLGLLSAPFGAPWTTLAAAFTLPSALQLSRRMAVETQPRGLQAVFGQTAKLHFHFGLWLAAGWALAWALSALGARPR